MTGRKNDQPGIGTKFEVIQMEGWAMSFTQLINRRAVSQRPQPQLNGRERQARRRRETRRGAAVTEFAIVAPVFLLMVVGFIEFGRALMVQQVLINASRVGARQASTTGATMSEVSSAVQDYTAALAVPGVDVSVTPDPGAADPGDPVTVTTSVNFNEVSWMASPWFLGGTTLNASSEMRKEGFE
jgi:Flp pilus assembly protein TadG